MSQPTWGRRDAIAACGGLAALAALGAAARSDTDNLIRPPGAVRESAFLARCLHCDRCRSICPTDVIVPADWGDGLRAMRTPKLDFRKGYCNFCGKCADVCPTGAIESFDKDAATVGLAELTECCIALRTGACRICYEKCPEDAITLSPENAPIIDPALCNGCGLCEKLCPANVFQSYRTGRERGIVVRRIAEEDEK